MHIRSQKIKHQTTRPSFIRMVDVLGFRVMRRMYLFTELCLFFLKALQYSISRKMDRAEMRRELMYQVYLIAIKRSLVSVLFFGVICGGVLGGFLSSQLTLWGDNASLGRALVAFLALEMAPLLVSVLMISRSAIIICSDIAHVNSQIAQKADTINMFRLSIYPRIMGGLISMACLVFCFVLVSFFAGFLVLVLTKDLSFSVYLDSVFQAMESLSHWLIVIVKVIVDAFIIFSLACFAGYKVHPNQFGLAEASAFVVRYSVSFVFFVNVGISLSYYALPTLWSTGIL